MEPKYTAAELAKHARQIFNTTPEVVTVALKIAGIENSTVEEAKKAVKNFLSKEVK